MSSTGFSENCIVLLSGPIAAGKSAVARSLIDRHNFKSISSGSHLKGLASAQGLGQSRADLQKLGDVLDEQTGFAWIVDDVAASALKATPGQKRWLLDSVRKKRQVDVFRARYGLLVLHAHLFAPEEVLRARYEARVDAGEEYAGNTPYIVAASHPNELSARSLKEIADIAIDLHAVDANDAADAILKHRDGRARLCDR